MVVGMAYLREAGADGQGGRNQDQPITNPRNVVEQGQIQYDGDDAGDRRALRGDGVHKARTVQETNPGEVRRGKDWEGGGERTL